MTTRTDNNREERGTGVRGAGKVGQPDSAPTRVPKMKGFVDGRVTNIPSTHTSGNR